MTHQTASSGAGTAARSGTPANLDHDAYRRDGFFGPLRLMRPDEAAAIRDNVEAGERHLGRSLHYYAKPHIVMRATADLIRHPVLLDAIGQIIGPDILVWDCAYVIKEPGDDRFVSWHQDLTYWGLDTDLLVSAWIALSPATEESGCMHFVPGSHLTGKQPHCDIKDGRNILHRGQTVSVSDGTHTQAVPLQPGEASLHHGWALHSSLPNRSADRRIGLTIQYAHPSIKQIVGAWDSASLVRGRDRFGHFAMEPRPREDFGEPEMAYRAAAERLKFGVYDAA